MEPKIYDGENAIVKLIDDLGADAANYCCDEAWLLRLNKELGLEAFASEDYQDEYIALSEILKTPEYSAVNIDDYYIRIACAAIEIRVNLPKDKYAEYQGDYSTDGGPVQNSMYEQLGMQSTEDYFQDKKGYEYSRDRMTNFIYTFKRSLGLFDDEDNLSYLALGGNTLGLYASRFLSEGYKARYLNALNMLPECLASRFQIELNAFARNSSSLGNNACIPKRIRRVGGLNSLKGCIKGCTLPVYGIHKQDDYRFLVNDQFALFLEWLEDNKQPQDEEMLDAWKESMLIEGCSGYYRAAAKHYKRAFYVETPEERVMEFTQYLNNVNKAIETRSRDIVTQGVTQGSNTGDGSLC